MNLLRAPWRNRLLAVGLGAVFVFASLDKIAHPPDFARIVYHYQLVGPSAKIPPLVPNLLAVVLPWIELLAGGLLIAGVWRREAASVTAALLIVFIAAVGLALHRGIDIENCGCFSVTAAGRRAGLGLMLADLGLLAVAVWLAARPLTTTGRDG